MIPSIGVVFASTGGNKVLRSIRSFRRMEPGLEIHVLVDQTTVSWKTSKVSIGEIVKSADSVRVIVNNHAYVNGGMNAAVQWMKDLGYSHACLLHDDLVFSHLPQHSHSISKWFGSEILLASSGLSFSHFEALSPEPGMDLRRRPEQWDEEDMESDALWNFLSQVDIRQNVDICPPGASYFFRYEGPDRVRMWNRIGPTCALVPISTWDSLGHFDETDGIFYDDDYATECFVRGLPPIYAVTNFPYIHLHNQSVNPWADPARGPWRDTVGAFVRRYGTDKVGIWRNDWEARWAMSMEERTV